MYSVFKKLSRSRGKSPPEEKFIERGAGLRFTISYENEIIQESPSPKAPPYYFYRVWLKLSYADGRRERNYKTEIANGTMTQHVESIVSSAARAAVRERIPTLLDLFKKYGSSYQLDGETKKLLQADVHFVSLDKKNL